MIQTLTMILLPTPGASCRPDSAGRILLVDPFVQITRLIRQFSHSLSLASESLVLLRS